MIKRDEAKRRIIAEWHPWVKSENILSANGRHGLLFFCFLEKERRHLLEFRASGDKWQDVHCWLLQEHLVSE
jgi:hypothetical protein